MRLYDIFIAYDKPESSARTGDRARKYKHACTRYIGTYVLRGCRPSRVVYELQHASRSSYTRGCADSGRSLFILHVRVLSFSMFCTFRSRFDITTRRVSRVISSNSYFYTRTPKRTNEMSLTCEGFVKSFDTALYSRTNQAVRVNCFVTHQSHCGLPGVRNIVPHTHLYYVWLGNFR